MPGIYLHIPFCKQRCRYCAFYSTTQHSLQQDYTDALCKELSIRKGYTTDSISTIYFGGGTPSLLNEEQLQKILKTIHDEYTILPDSEITIECNPDDLTPYYLEMLKNIGINRISIGIQSLCNQQLELLGRRHNAESAKEAVRNARAAGFDNISIDLMFALPHSTNEQWNDTLNQAIALRPDHISAYNHTYEENTSLHRALQKGDFKELSEEENIAQFNTLIEKLEEAGYNHYEISNFARPGYESRHNSSYWNDTPYIGCGAGAHSYNGTSRGWNISDIKEYIKGINKGMPAFEVEELTTEERYNDAILTRLRTATGIPTEWIKEKFGNALYNYMMKIAQKEISLGNLRINESGNLSLTKKGLFISDAVIRELIFI